MYLALLLSLQNVIVIMSPVTCKEGGEQVEEGMRSRGGTVPADET